MKLSNKTLNLILTEGGSLDQSIQILKSLQLNGKIFATVPELIDGMKSHVSNEPQKDNSSNKISSEITPVVNNPIDDNSNKNNTTGATITAADRDLLFEYISSQDCNIFSESVKFSNKNLDELIVASGNNVQYTLSYIHYLNDICQQFSNIPDLIQKLEQLHLSYDENVSKLQMLINNNMVVLFAPTVSASVDISEISKYYISMHAYTILLTYIQQIISDVQSKQQSKFSSTENFWLHIQSIHSSIVSQQKQDRDSVEQFFVENSNLLSFPVSQITITDLHDIANSGRTFPYRPVPSQSVEVLKLFREHSKHFDSTPQLCFSISYHLRNSNKSWIQNGDRDQLFDFLASDHCKVFSDNVKLNNKALDSLLMATGETSHTIQMCKMLTEQGKDHHIAVNELVTSVRDLFFQTYSIQVIDSTSNNMSTEAIASSKDSSLAKVPVQSQVQTQQDNNTIAQSFVPTPVTSATAAATTTVPDSAVTSAPKSAIATSATADWITEAERDALFQYLADPNTNIFSTNVKLSNKALNSLLTEGQSLENTINLCNQLQAKGIVSDSVARLLEQLKAIKGQSAENPANQSASAQPINKPAASTTASASWIQSSDRDQLFEYLANPDTNLFTENVKLNNKALNSILMEGGSLIGTLDQLKKLQETGNTFATVAELIEGLKQFK